MVPAPHDDEHSQNHVGDEKQLILRLSDVEAAANDKNHGQHGSDDAPVPPVRRLEEAVDLEGRNGVDDHMDQE
jgi:hypothetical protein